MTPAQALERFDQNHHLAADRGNTYPQVTKRWIESETETTIIVAYIVDNGQTTEQRAVRYFKAQS